MIAGGHREAATPTRINPGRLTDSEIRLSRSELEGGSVFATARLKKRNVPYL